MARSEVARRVVKNTFDAIVISQMEREGEWYAYASILGVRGQLANGSTREEVEIAALRKLAVDNNKFIASVLEGRVVMD
jgi:hypothetical protein